jgi:hypothetical protein
VGVDEGDGVAEGEKGRSEEAAGTEPGDVVIGVDQDLVLVEPLLVRHVGQVAKDLLLEGPEVGSGLEQAEDVGLLGRCQLDAGQDREPGVAGGDGDGVDVLHRVVVGDGDDIEARAEGRLDDGAGRHGQLPAGGETGVDVEVGPEPPQLHQPPRRPVP